MAIKKNVVWGLSLLFSLGTIGVIGLSLVLLGGNFSSLITTVLRPKATAVTPKINKSINEPFRTGSIDSAKWATVTRGSVNIYETATDNLRMDVSKGTASPAQKYNAGNLTYKTLLKDNADFRTVAVIYRPVLQGDGTGNSGMAFSSASNLNNEGASITWRVASDSGRVTSKVVFDVKAPNGTSLIHKEADMMGNVGVIGLIRVNKLYRAIYHGGNDLSGDTANIVLGEIENNELGQDGQLRLFTNNSGTPNKNPRVIGRFDSVSIGYQTSENAVIPTPSSNGFSDNFANGVVSQKWHQNASTGVSISESTAKNLLMTVPSGAVNNKPKRASVNRLDPVVPKDKNFTFTSTVFRPVVVGDGTAASGISFQSTSNLDDEGSTVEWQATGNTRADTVVIFSVRAANGTLLESSRTKVPAGVVQLQFRIMRNNKKYSASVHWGDSDTPWLPIGSEQNDNLGKDGILMLYTKNIGPKYPFVFGQFDGASGNVEK